MDSILFNLPTPSFEVKPYEELEWIASSGTQYVNTGISLNSNNSIEVDAILNSGNTLMGVYGSSSTRHAIEGSGSGYWYPQYATGAFLTSVSRTVRATVGLYKNVAKINGTVVNTFTASSFSGASNYFIFCRNSSGSTEDYCTARLYGAKIWDSTDALVRNYIPVRLTQSVTNSSGGTSVLGDVGLWDKVTGVFYENRGSGVFTYPTYLYKAGDECVDLTGGWNEGFHYSNPGVFTKLDTQLYQYAQNGQDVYMELVNSINLGGYTKITATGSMVSTGSSASIGFYLNNSAKQNWQQFVGSSSRVSNTSTTQLTWDISSYNGTYYLGMNSGSSVSQSSSVTSYIDKIWLE